VHAITITRPGPPDVLRWDEVADPSPGPGEVLIDVVASAVNRADLLQRQGYYPSPPGGPPYPGLECSGRVTAVGPLVSSWSVGDEVCALLPGGGYAERVAVAESCVLPVPAGVPLDEAAALPEAACTVWSNLVTAARIRGGETLLVHGGASGIGTFAIQFAKALGVTVYATARAAKHEAVAALGARPIDYENADFADQVEADVILDIIGGKYLDRNIAALRPNGRLVIIGLQGGRRAELDLGALMAKRATIIATTLRARPLDEKAAIVAGVRQQVWPLVESRQIQTLIDRRIPMRDAAAAHEAVERSEHIGKVLLIR
jgi:putative PIG3 family NAD(P)H quinone oxidoreductase